MSLKGNSEIKKGNHPVTHGSKWLFKRKKKSEKLFSVKWQILWLKRSFKHTIQKHFDVCNPVAIILKFLTCLLGISCQLLTNNFCYFYLDGVTHHYFVTGK